MRRPWTRGWPFPDCENPDPPQSCLFISTEDDAAEIRRRLEAAGADLDRVGIARLSHAAGFTLSDLGGLIRMLDEVGPDCRAVFLDPISSHLGRVDGNSQGELRGVLSPLIAMAEARDLAIIGVTHLNKSEGRSAANRVAGSTAWVNAARSVLLFEQDPQDRARTVLLPAKSNLARRVTGLSFRRVSSPGDPEVGMITWDQNSIDMTADEWLELNVQDGLRKRPGPPPAKTQECLAWLREFAGGQPVRVGVARSEAERVGYNVGTLYNAVRLGEFKEFELDSRKWWKPPSTSPGTSALPMATSHDTPPPS